jgi:acyl-CoA reductase-like NAD-dependent aldehyde dehydrogenase
MTYIDGVWRGGPAERRIAVINPTTEQGFAAVVASSVGDVDAAVRAAGRAFAEWSRTSHEERSAVLRATADQLEKNREAIAETIAKDVGTPIKIASRVQAQLPITVLRSYADLLDEGQPDEQVGNTLVLREPVGVVAAITPWNYPLHQIVAKLAPALAAGATVILKPSEVAPLAAHALIDAIEAAGCPAGVVNLVHGRGPEAGRWLVEHPRVDMVSFTGSLAAGSVVGSTAAAAIKRVTLELGGKSANIVLPDADLETAVRAGVGNAFLNGGQTCSAWTRLLVPAARHDEACELAAAVAETFVPGDPLEAGTKLGPMVSAAQRQRVRDLIDIGLREGARLITGGTAPPEGLDRGYFVRPTVLGAVEPDATVAQEEIFGPVLSVLTYADEDEAVAIANNSKYGLHGAVWSADPERALNVARRLRTGAVDINGAAYNPMAPFGGYKSSGFGRELGRFGLEDYQEIKAVQR